MVHTLDPLSPDPSIIAEAAACLLRGGLVAFPTETVYGLGANALDAEAVRRIFLAKQRPANDPLIVHIAAVEDLPWVALDVSPLAETLIRAFWPGPLTLLLPRHPDLPEEVTAGLSIVAVRLPAHPVARALIAAAGVPVAAPSANRFSHTSPTQATHVLDDLNGRVEMILDAGATTMGVESTVLDPAQNPPVILRLGSLPRGQIEALIGPVRIAPAGETAAASPGRLLRHYAPDAQLVLCPFTETEKICSFYMDKTKAFESQGKQVGWLTAEEIKLMVDTRIEESKVYTLGSLHDPRMIARHLFAGIRKLEAEGVDIILAHLLPPDGLGEAINDRLTRASFHIES
jgi:L-threonylcarbamoyladenylate synthase